VHLVSFLPDHPYNASCFIANEIISSFMQEGNLPIPSQKAALCQEFLIQRRKTIALQLTKLMN
jgi:hypothetical protein